MKKLPVIFMFILGVAACEKESSNPCVENLQPNCGCYLIYAPVCGCNGKTYGNDCEAECNGITEYTQGACP